MIAAKEDILSKMEIRELSENDDLQELTLLLNKSYKSLAEQGFYYTASHQDVSITKKRLRKAKCLIAVFKNKLIGTIAYYSPENAHGNEWYDLDFVATYGQFAVDPEFQGMGLGGMLIDKVEELAAKDKAIELAIDTSEGATDLISFYKKRGYCHVGYTQWKEVNYRSVLLSKKIS